MVVFYTLCDVPLLTFRVGEGKNLTIPVAGGIRGDVILGHTACTGSRVSPTVVITTGKNIFHFSLLHNTRERLLGRGQNSKKDRSFPGQFPVRVLCT
jgi:hypothetical protein